MRCPFCGNIDTQVKDSRPAEDHVSIRRRRFCPACGGRTKRQTDFSDVAWYVWDRGRLLTTRAPFVWI